MKNIILSCLVLSCLVLSGVNHAAEVGSRENPDALVCNTCYSNLDFRNHAKQNVPTNSSGYWLVLNQETQTVKTVYAINNREPEIGFQLKKAMIVSTLPEHKAFIDEEFMRVAQGEPERTVEIDYPSGEGCCFVNDGTTQFKYFKYIRIELAKKWLPWRFKLFNTNVKLKFSNKDVAYVYVFAYGTPSQIYIAIDSNGTVIASTGASGGSSGASAGTTIGGNVTFSIPTFGGGSQGLSCTFINNTLNCKTT